jgi:large subunit ribosomal protein L32
MAVPKRRTSSSKRDMRRANHDKVTPVQYITCSNCGEVSLPHRVCGACGWYKGKLATIVKGS